MAEVDITQKCVTFCISCFECVLLLLLNILVDFVSVSVSVLHIVYCASLECTLWLILLLQLVTFCPWAVNRWREGGGRGGPTSQVANIVINIRKS